MADIELSADYLVLWDEDDVNTLLSLEPGSGTNVEWVLDPLLTNGALFSGQENRTNHPGFTNVVIGWTNVWIDPGTIDSNCTIIVTSRTNAAQQATTDVKVFSFDLETNILFLCVGGQTNALLSLTTTEEGGWTIEPDVGPQSALFALGPTNHGITNRVAETNRVWIAPGTKNQSYTTTVESSFAFDSGAGENYKATLTATAHVVKVELSTPALVAHVEDTNNASFSLTPGSTSNVTWTIQPNRGTNGARFARTATGAGYTNKVSNTNQVWIAPGLSNATYTVTAFATVWTNCRASTGLWVQAAGVFSKCLDLFPTGSIPQYAANQFISGGSNTLIRGNGKRILRMCKHGIGEYKNKPYSTFAVSFNLDHKIPDWVAHGIWTNLTNSVINRPPPKPNTPKKETDYNKWRKEGFFAPDNFYRDLSLHQAVKDYSASTGGEIMPIDTQIDTRDFQGYARGHLAPAADLRWSRAGFFNSFMFSNMGPQDKSFNSGTWGGLEKGVRRWAKEKKETLYIVTGLFGKKAINGPHQITVSAYFYKVLYTPYSNQSISVMITNDASANDFPWYSTNYVMSVQQIEQKVDMIFFEGLEVDKTMVDTNFWGFK